MKTCQKCKLVKPLEDFHNLKSSKDGRQSRCKECAIATTKEWYRNTRAARLEYEKLRNPGRMEALWLNAKKLRAKYPEKYKARTAVGNALRDKRLFRKPCCVCGEIKVEAHHEDYSKPLAVTWFCHLHHRMHENRSVLLAPVV